jgi:hypothetical protein
LRNEPNFERPREVGLFFDAETRRRGGGRGRLETAEFLEGAVVVAVGGVNAALESGEGLAVGRERFAEGGGSFGVPAVHALEGVLPELGLGETEASLEPVAGDQSVDQGALFRGGGLVAVVVFGGEGGEGCWVFAADDLGVRVDAGLEGVHTGDGFARWGAGSGGFSSVEAVGLDLFLS